MLQELKPISKQVGYDVILCSNDKLIPVDNLMDDESQKIVICGDFICQKNQKPLVDYFYLSQSFYKTPKYIRLNCSHYYIYDFGSNNEKNLISRELGVDKEQFSQATKKNTISSMSTSQKKR